MALVHRGAALFVSDKDAPEQLVGQAIDAVRDDGKLRLLSMNILKMALPDSAAIIAKEVIKLAEGK
jgi:UDP-N-acetylglucosamine--N-acetylmuramyl-(pentapeptide) pyrophosphoryl-undecaprenol N-acetylglucosamine transferase